MKKKKWLWILVSLVVLIIILVVVFGGKKEAREVSVEKAEIRSLVENVLASGKIQPETEIKIQSQISGQIIELPIKEGDVVLQGQVLVKINPDIYVSALNRADAALNSARSSLASARARLAQSEAQFKVQELNMNRQKNLFDQKAISQSEFDNTVSQFETAKAEVVASKESIHSAEFSIASAQASQNEASDNLKRTTILSPMTGTVTALTKEIGETVLGNNMMSGDVIMRISALNSMEVNVEVNESDIVRVGLGDTALVEVDAYKDKKFKGLVTEIGNTALNALNNAALSMDQVTNFSVKVRILRESYTDLAEGKPESFSPFRPGMSADVEVQTARADNVLTIPIKAVTSREDTTSKSLVERLASSSEEDENETTIKKKPITCVFVYNEAEGKAELRAVKTGIQDDQYIHILEGLNPGDQIITGPYEEVSRKLVKGDKVELKKSKKEEEQKD
jgi:HlyD family secretion protein